MTFGQRLCAFVLSLSLPGCSFFHYAAHNACHDLSRASQGRHEERYRHKLADEAWARYQPKCSRKCPSVKDFAAGFHAGYVDYLVYDGPGEPPLVPLAKYWTVAYQNPEGRDAIQAWNDGFRVGASVARDDGFHQFQILPIASPIQEFHGIALTAKNHAPLPATVQDSREAVVRGSPDRAALASAPAPQMPPETKVVATPPAPVTWYGEEPEGHQ